jgi:hypothetical protein
MTDIVERLRLLQSGVQWACGARTAATLEEAADEIERLRAELINTRLDRDNARRLVEAARREEREAIARDLDCGCPKETKAAVLEALRGGFNSAKRWTACGHSQCSAIDAAAIRARGDAAGLEVVPVQPTGLEYRGG